MNLSVLFFYITLAAVGARNNPIMERIVGGYDSPIETIPWVATIHYYRLHRCGAAIVDDDIILTGGHCFNVSEYPSYMKAFKVRVGTTYRATGGSLHEVERVIRHPRFNISNYNYDIAVVKLKTKMIFDETKQPIALPEFNESLPYDQQVLVSGWGFLAFNGFFPRILQSVALPIVNQTECEEVYRFVNPVADHMFCAGSQSEAKDSCKGDSGGPAVANNKLVGIISWGVQCALTEYPGVYTRVSAFRNWIDETIQWLRRNDTSVEHT